MIDWNISMNGAQSITYQNAFNLHWKIAVNQHQYSGSYEKEQSRFAFTR